MAAEGGGGGLQQGVAASLSFGGFWVGSSNMMKSVDPKVFQTWREPRNDVM